MEQSNYPVAKSHPPDAYVVVSVSYKPAELLLGSKEKVRKTQERKDEPQHWSRRRRGVGEEQNFLL